MDKGSSNGTMKGTLKLKPNVMYHLDDNEEIKFGNVKMKFFKPESEKEKEKENTSTNEDSFLVPETPFQRKRVKDTNNSSLGGSPIPESQSRNSSVSIPQSPLQESLNSSSFLMPSQPMNKSTPSPILSRIKSKSEAELLDCATEPIEPLSKNEFQEQSTDILLQDTEPIQKQSTSEILDMETQPIAGPSSILDMETQPISGGGYAPSPMSSSLKSKSEAELLDCATEPLLSKNEFQDQSTDILLQDTEPIHKQSATAILDMETQPIAGASSILDMETQPISGGSYAPSSTLNLQLAETQPIESSSNKSDSSSHSMHMTNNQSSIMDMETQEYIKGSGSGSYDHTKGSQKMEIDETLEVDDKIFDMPTQSTTMDTDNHSDNNSDMSDDLLDGIERHDEINRIIEDKTNESTHNEMTKEEEESILECATQLEIPEDDENNGRDNTTENDDDAESDTSSVDLVS